MQESYGRIISTIWTDPDFTALTTATQLLYIRLVSSEARNHAGVLPLTVRRWAKSTADTTPESILKALNDLEAARFVVVDYDTEEVLIRTFIRNDNLWKQPKMMRCAISFALQVQSPTVRSALAEVISSCPGFCEEDDWVKAVNALVETPNEPLARGSVGVSEGLGEPLRRGHGVGVGVGVGLKPSFKEKGKTNFRVRVGDGQTVHVTDEVRGVVQSAVKPAVLRARATREGLMGHAQLLFDDGATVDELRVTLGEWCNRTDVFPGHLPHVYSDLARRTNGATNGKPDKLRVLAEMAAEEREKETNARKAVER